MENIELIKPHFPVPLIFTAAIPSEKSRADSRLEAKKVRPFIAIYPYSSFVCTRAMPFLNTPANLELIPK